MGTAERPTRKEPARASSVRISPARQPAEPTPPEPTLPQPRPTQLRWAERRGRAWRPMARTLTAGPPRSAMSGRSCAAAGTDGSGGPIGAAASTGTSSPLVSGTASTAGDRVDDLVRWPFRRQPLDRRRRPERRPAVRGALAGSAATDDGDAPAYGTGPGPPKSSAIHLGHGPESVRSRRLADSRDRRGQELHPLHGRFRRRARLGAVSGARWTASAFCARPAPKVGASSTRRAGSPDFDSGSPTLTAEAPISRASGIYEPRHHRQRSGSSASPCDGDPDEGDPDRRRSG